MKTSECSYKNRIVLVLRGLYQILTAEVFSNHFLSLTKSEIKVFFIYIYFIVLHCTFPEIWVARQLLSAFAVFSWVQTMVWLPEKKSFAAPGTRPASVLLLVFSQTALPTELFPPLSLREGLICIIVLMN